MGFEIQVEDNGKQYVIPAKGGDVLLNALRKTDTKVPHPCNGKGKCGKCLIRVTAGHVSPVSKEEASLIGKKRLDAGYRLACLARVEGHVSVSMGEKEGKARIVTDAAVPVVKSEKVRKIKPLVEKVCVRVPVPSLADQRPDDQRLLHVLCNAIGHHEHHHHHHEDGSSCGILRRGIPLSLSRQLPGVFRKGEGTVTLLMREHTVLGVEPGDTTAQLFGAAVDIGTTTLAAYLLDFKTGETRARCARLNSQRTYGADVISRIQHAQEQPDGLETLQRMVLTDLGACITELANEAGISPSSIVQVAVAGNTTMLHLLMGIHPFGLAQAPFIPVTTGLQTLPLGEISPAATSLVPVHPGALFTLLPGVSAYVGADTVAAVLATGMDQAREIALLVDLGTNGEIVLGNRDRLLACSTAAGPAFEGAGIRNGMGAVEGAMDRITWNEDVSCTVLGEQKPLGLCGTALLDGMAGLVSRGILDETGRFNEEEEWPPSLTPALRARIHDVDGDMAFVLADDGDTADGRTIALTQRDVRSFQNAKAAVAAGISVLIREYGITPEQVTHVYLAGGMGTMLQPDSAIVTGLVPAALKGRIVPVGNAAGEGAQRALTSRRGLKAACRIAADMAYLELSGRKDFSDLYVECMLFE